MIKVENMNLSLLEMRKQHCEDSTEPPSCRSRNINEESMLLLKCHGYFLMGCPGVLGRLLRGGNCSTAVLREAL